jgi:DNA (cytosine-5)-methyltransferase 1
VTFGSLCAGIGGFDLGLERAGLECLWQVEIDPFCRQVLDRHWPDVVKYDDVRTVHFHDSCWEDGCGQCLSPVDVVVAGFPCQPVAHHGHRRAESDARWLWPEIGRLVGELEPGFVVLENVAGLLYPGRGFSRILADLATLGFDAEWECVPAVAVGAPHYRDRVWVVAYRPSDGRQAVAPSRIFLQGPQRDDLNRRDPYPPRRNADASAWDAYKNGAGPQPGILRKAYGLSGGLDRVRGLGNAVLPDLAQWLGRRLIAARGL